MFHIRGRQRSAALGSRTLAILQILALATNTDDGAFKIVKQNGKVNNACQISPNDSSRLSRVYMFRNRTRHRSIYHACAVHLDHPEKENRTFMPFNSPASPQSQSPLSSSFHVLYPFPPHFPRSHPVLAPPRRRPSRLHLRLPSSHLRL